MKKSLPLLALDRIFNAVLLTFFGVFMAFCVYLYLAFSGVLIGDVKTDTAPQLLMGLQTKQFEAAIGRLEARKNLSDIPADLPDPFGAPRQH